MKAIKKVLNNIFIDGLSGMALGLFSTLIIGTILKQIGDLMGGTYAATNAPRGSPGPDNTNAPVSDNRVPAIRFDA